MNEKAKVIAIDGPSGSGKSTIAKNLAKSLGFHYLDTGAMFRSLSVILNREELKEEELISQKLSSIDFKYAPSASVLVEIDGEDLTQKIREHEVSALASFYSQFPCIRKFLAKKQREIASVHSSVLEGRDIGTVIFPNAALKIFLTADSRVRAKRRLEQLIEKNPDNDKKYTIDSILNDIKERDLKDSQRENAPLLKAEDAIEVDTSLLSIDEVENKIKKYYQERKELFQ